MAAFWRRESDQVTKRCWQCDAKLPSTGTLCARCGATRVREEQKPHLAIPANGWYAPPDINDVPKRYSNKPTRTDTAAKSPSTSSSAEQETGDYIYTPPIFEPEVYTQPTARTFTQRAVSSGPVYRPPESLYDVQDYSVTARDDQPDDSWLARFQD